MEDVDNTKMIAENIFTRDPGLVNSIELELEEQTREFAINNNGGVGVFIEEILCNIVYHGIKIIFSLDWLNNIQFNTITVANFTILMKLLSERELSKLQEYTMSFGYKIKFDATNIYNGFERII